MNGRVALVTGGGRGIGREAALLLSAAGARVMVVSRSATELAALGLEYVAADLGHRGLRPGRCRDRATTGAD
jgi:NAD(P)-dependent dehydrogenase (short-subunit alcohol dehydrogenase family)